MFFMPRKIYVDQWPALPKTPNYVAPERKPAQLPAPVEPAPVLAVSGEVMPPADESRPNEYQPGETRRRVIHEDRSPLTETRAFLYRYAALAAVLLILSVGVTEVAGWPRVAGLVMFGGLAVGGFLSMHFWDTRHTLASLQARAIDADERIKLEQVRAEAAHRQRVAELEHAARVAAQRQLTEQVNRHSEPQSHSNQLANYQDPDPPVDVLRAELIAFLAGLYDPGKPGRLTSSGRIMDVTVPWSARGSLDAEDKRRAVSMLTEAETAVGVWLVQQRNRAWYLNTKRFPTAGRLVQAFDAVKTPRRRDS